MPAVKSNPTKINTIFSARSRFMVPSFVSPQSGHDSASQLIAASRTRLWLASGWGCRGRHAAEMAKTLTGAVGYGSLWTNSLFLVLCERKIVIYSRPQSASFDQGPLRLTAHSLLQKRASRSENLHCMG